MSFRCEWCKESQPNGTKPTRLVIETRERIYLPRYDRSGAKIDNGGKGTEIVKEMNVCSGCAEFIDYMAG